MAEQKRSETDRRRKTWDEVLLNDRKKLRIDSGDL